MNETHLTQFKELLSTSETFNEVEEFTKYMFDVEIFNIGDLIIILSEQEVYKIVGCIFHNDIDKYEYLLREIEV